MGRPRKDEADGRPTRERIIDEAIRLFSERGLDAVGIRDITAACGIKESSLYNHFTGKAELVRAVLERLSLRMVRPGLEEARALAARRAGDTSLDGLLLEGARAFFSRADEEMLRLWRILMAAQYRFAEARDCLRSAVLEEPQRFFRELLEAELLLGRIDPSADLDAAAACVSAAFFEFSFRSNLELAWGEPEPEALERLHGALRLLSAALGAGGESQ